MPYASCNAILAAADLHLPLQDTGATTSLDGGGTLVGGDNASDKTTTGPGKGYPLALQLNGSDDYITMASETDTTDYTLWMWLKIDTDPPGAAGQTGFGRFGEPSTAAGASHYTWTDGSIYCSTLRNHGAPATSANRVTVGNPTPALTSWRHVLVRSKPGASGWAFLLDGTSLSSTTGQSTLNIDSDWTLGRSEQNGPTYYYLDGAVAGFGRIAEWLDNDDAAELVAGKEPTYTSGASLGDAGAWNVGTWDSYSNGALTYSVAAAEADGTPVDTGSGATGTLDLSSAAGELVYLYVRASNNGGYDVGDFATRTGAYGSADDGYYEVASVTAAGGGPSPTGRRRIIRQLIGA